MRIGWSGFALTILAFLIMPAAGSLVIPAGSSVMEIARAPGQDSPQWPSLGGGPSNDNRVASNYSLLMPVIAWNVTIGDQGTFPGSVVIDADNDIVLSSGRTIYRFDDKGSLIWKREILNVKNDEEPSVPALDSAGNIYSVLRNGTLLSLHPDGSTRWFLDLEDYSIDTWIGPPVISNDVLYYAGSTGRVHAVDTNGSLIWRHPLHRSAIGSVAVSGSGLIAVASTDEERELLLLDGEGNQIWAVGFPEYETASPPSFDGDGNVYVSLNDDHRGSVVRSYHPNGTLRFESVKLDTLSHDPGDIRKGLTIAGNGDLILAQTNGYIARMRGNGMVLWENFYEGRKDYSASVGSDGTMIVPRGDRLLMINPDGSLKSTVPAFAYTRAAAFDANGSGYLLDREHGVLTRIDMIPNPPPVPVQNPSDITFDEDTFLYLETEDMIEDQWTDPIEVSIESDGDVLSLEKDPSRDRWKMTAEENFHGNVTARFIISDTGPDMVRGTEDDPVVIGNEFHVNVTAVNDPPDVEEIGTLMLVGENRYSILINATDIDSDDDYLTYTFRSSYIEWAFLIGNILILEPAYDQDYYYDGITVSVRDDLGGETVIDVDIRVDPPNLPPEVEVDDGRIIMDEDRVEIVDVGTRYSSTIRISDPNDDPVFFSFIDGPHIRVVDTGEDHIELVPEKDWYGWTNFTIHLDDGVNEAEYPIQVWITSEEDPVRDLSISLSPGSGELTDLDPVTLQADYTDPDGEGEYVEIEWYSNISGYLGEGPTLNVTLESGYHTVEVTVSRRYSNNPQYAQVMIFVADYKEEAGDGPEYSDFDDVGEMGETFIIGGALYLLILILPAAAVAIHRIKLRKSGLTGRKGTLTDDGPDAPAQGGGLE
ncbi:MAG: PQQ-binding-like beta-propeller repeat protein [Thermoplasmatota archaeon]